MEGTARVPPPEFKFELLDFLDLLLNLLKVHRLGMRSSSAACSTPIPPAALMARSPCVPPPASRTPTTRGP